MTRRLLLALLTGLLLYGGAAAQSQEGDGETFSGLTVVSYGEQEVDLFTGATILPEGGQIIAREHGVEIDGERIEYVEGDYLEAQGVDVVASFGSARAAELHIDLTSGDLTAAGGLSFSANGQAIEAQGMRYDDAANVVSFTGPVTGAGPEFEAAAMVMDVDGSNLLLLAPYRYQDGLFELTSQEEGAMLALTRVGDEEQGGGSYRASSSVSPELLERLGAYLP